MSVHFGIYIKVDAGGLAAQEYVDIVNFDWYDIIVGTPYMHKHGVVLDFKWSQVIVDRWSVPTVRVEADDTDGCMHRHQAMACSHKAGNMQ